MEGKFNEYSKSRESDRSLKDKFSLVASWNNLLYSNFASENIQGNSNE